MLTAETSGAQRRHFFLPLSALCVSAVNKSPPRQFSRGAQKTVDCHFLHQYSDSLKGGDIAMAKKKAAAKKTTKKTTKKKK
jgi:hypothetical protein